MNRPKVPPTADTRESLIALLGADFQTVVAPIKGEIRTVARETHGDLHRAAMQLLADDRGRGRSSFEQRLILAALADFQETTENVVAETAGRG